MPVSSRHCVTGRAGCKRLRHWRGNRIWLHSGPELANARRFTTSPRIAGAERLSASKTGTPRISIHLSKHRIRLGARLRRVTGFGRPSESGPGLIKVYHATLFHDIKRRSGCFGKRQSRLACPAHRLSDAREIFPLSFCFGITHKSPPVSNCSGGSTELSNNVHSFTSGAYTCRRFRNPEIKRLRMTSSGMSCPPCITLALTRATA